MATNSEVLSYLIPNGGYVQIGDTYEGISFIDCEPLTEKQYKYGFAQFDKWQASELKKTKESKASAQTKLAALGLTEEEITSILG